MTRSSECSGTTSSKVISMPTTNATAKPSARAYHTAITLNSGSCLILYGGFDLVSNTIHHDVWELCFSDLETPLEWHLIDYKGDSPGSRYGHAAASLPGDRMIVFGGSSRFPNDFLNDAWEFDRILERWIALNGIGDVKPRRFHSLTFIQGSASTRQVVLYGGVERYAMINGTVDVLDYESATCSQEGYFLTFCNLTNSYVCSTCPAGFQPAENRLGCQQCPRGYFAAAASSECTACPSGTYGPQLGAENQSDCLLCASGSSSSTVGAFDIATCSDCVAGSFSPAGAAECTLCPAGTRSNGGASSCESCDDGFYSHEGQEECEPCPEGTYGLINSTHRWCFTCPKGFYSHANATSCTPCPVGTSGQLLKYVPVV